MSENKSFQEEWTHIRFGYRYHENDRKVGSFTFPAFEEIPWIRHGFSARTGGLSTGSLASLNLSFTRKEEPRERTKENYRIFCRAEGIPPESMIMDSYEHGTTVRRVSNEDRGKGFDRDPLPFCDGLVTNDPSVSLMTGHADCMAFYFIDPEHKAIGLAHAGWRGAFSCIGSEAVRKMTLEFGSDPSVIYAGVGPSICPQCFEVDTDLGEQFAAAFPEADCLLPGKRENKAQVDLWRVAAAQFLRSGIRADHISIMGVCTVEDDRLFSFRGDNRKTGGMTAYLRIVSPED